MTEKEEMTKKPIWKPFNPKEVVEGNKIFIEEIATLKTRLQDFEYHRDSAKPHSVPTMKAHFAIVCALLDYQLRNMEFLQGFLESFVEPLLQRLQLHLEFLPDHIDLAVVGDIPQHHVRYTLVDKAVPDVPMRW